MELVVLLEEVRVEAVTPVNHKEMCQGQGAERRRSSVRMVPTCRPT